MCVQSFSYRVTREIKKAKREYYKTLFDDNLNNMKKTWQGIKEIVNLNSKAHVQISQIRYEGKQLKTNVSMANAFNDFFTNIGAKLDKEIPQGNIKKGPTTYLRSRVENNFIIHPTNPQEISDIIDSLVVSKSSGHVQFQQKN